MKKLFSIQPGLTSVTYPIVKMIIALLVIVLAFVISMHFTISAIWVVFLIRLICVVALFASVLRIYISIGELIIVHENKNGSSMVQLGKTFKMEYVISLVEKNDIVEIEIKTQGQVIRVGASSDCKAGSSVFFDKKYYIGDDEYETLDLFEKALSHYAANGELRVITIDGIKVERW